MLVKALGKAPDQDSAPARTLTASLWGHGQVTALMSSVCRAHRDQGRDFRDEGMEVQSTGRTQLTWDMNTAVESGPEASPSAQSRAIPT